MFCKNKGAFEHEGTPSELVTDRGLELFNAYTMIKNYNVWPDSGGSSGFSALLINAVQYCDRVQIKLDHYKKNADEARKKLAQQMQKMNRK